MPHEPHTAHAPSTWADSFCQLTEPCDPGALLGEEGPCGSTMGPREHRHPAALGEGLGHLPWQPPMPRGDARAPGSLLPPSFTPLPSSRLHSLLRVCLAGCLFLA